MAISFFSLFANMQKFTTPPTYFRPSNAKTPRQAERRRKKKTKRKEKNFKKEQRTQFVKIFILMAWRDGKHFWFALKCTIWRFFSLIVCFGGL